MWGVANAFKACPTALDEEVAWSPLKASKQAAVSPYVINGLWTTESRQESVAQQQSWHYFGSDKAATRSVIQQGINRARRPWF